MEDEISPMLAPVVALVIWTLILQLRLQAARLRAMNRGGDQSQWHAAGNTHPMEQPTLFYAIAIAMALLHGHGESRTNFALAWAYVFLTIAHSLVPASANADRHKALLFNLASIVLLGLALHAAIHAF